MNNPLFSAKIVFINKKHQIPLTKTATLNEFNVAAIIYSRSSLSSFKKENRIVKPTFYNLKGSKISGMIAYIIPGIPPPIEDIPASSGSSAITHSVVNNIAATDAAF